MDSHKFAKMADEELLSLYADLMEALRNRALVRSSNNPVADYAERVAVEQMQLTRAAKEERGFDATDRGRKKYQVKGRRPTRHNQSRQLGVIRDLDEHLFDYLVAVIFGEHFEVLEIWKIPYAFVSKHVTWSKHQNGHIFQAKPHLLLSDKSVKRVA